MQTKIHSRQVHQRTSFADQAVVPSSAAKFRARIIAGDVIETLRKQNSATKFDVVIADPPYNICKDFGNNNDNMPIDEYVAWCREWLAQCFRLLARGGLVYVYGFAEILARVAVEYPLHEQRWLAWHYTNKAVPSSRFWQRSHESILCLWQPGGKRPDIEIEQIRVPYTPHFLNCLGKKRQATAGRYSRRGKQTIYNDNGGALPRDVIDVPALAGGAGRAERWFACRECGGEARPPSELPEHAGHDVLKHPTQKPMALTRQLLLSRINDAGGRVLIPFAGSGSECVVAKSLGVQFLGVEINPEFVRFARSWLQRCLS